MTCSEMEIQHQHCVFLAQPVLSNIKGTLQSTAVAVFATSFQNGEDSSLPVATGKGEPVGGGVAGTAFGGRGGGARKREVTCQWSHASKVIQQSKRRVIWAFINTPSLGNGPVMVYMLKMATPSVLANLCQLDTSQSHWKRGNLDWKNGSVRQGCRQACRAFFFLFN